MENTAPAGPKAISLTQERQHSWWDAGTVSFASVPSVIHEKSNLQDVVRGLWSSDTASSAHWFQGQSGSYSGHP